METSKEKSEGQTAADLNSQKDFESWPLDELSDYIVHTHHRFVEQQIQLLRPDLEQICREHGARHPELFQIKSLFWEASGDMARHQKKEEIMLFPFIKKMAKALESNDDLKTLPSQPIENRVKMLTEEHDDQQAAFKKMAALSNDFTPPADASDTFRVTFARLSNFHRDLRQHIHLENDILFPRSLKLLTQLTS